MAKARKKTGTGSKKTTTRRKKIARKRRVPPRAKTSRVKKAVRKTSRKAAPRRKAAVRPAASRSRRAARSLDRLRSTTRGLGPEAGGQSGDTEGLSRAELADSESVEELLEEGQAFEAGIVSGVENARNADEGGVRTRQVPEDDVPQEYLDED